MILVIRLHARHKLQKLVEAAPVVLIDVFSFFVDQAIRQKEYLHSNFFCNHILRHIISDHQTLLWFDIQPFCYLPIILRVRLAVSDILIGRIQFKILRLQSRPANAALSSLCGENWVC